MKIEWKVMISDMEHSESNDINVIVTGSGDTIPSYSEPVVQSKKKANNFGIASFIL